MKTIVIADDEEDLRTIVQLTLEDPRYRILLAADGEAALQLARNEFPDLLILDWMMPGMNGIEVMRELHKEPATSKIPVIMLTAKDRKSDHDEGVSVGAKAYLVKPFSPLDLLEKVQNTLAQDSYVNGKR